MLNGDAGSRVVTVLEQDGDVAHLECRGPKCRFEVVATLRIEGDTLLLDGLHIEGSGPNVLGPSELRAFAREFGRQYGVQWVVVQGAARTSGANPGHLPRPIRIRVT